MLLHLRMTSISKNLDEYLHTTIPAEKNQNGLNTTTIKYFCHMVNI